MSDLVSNIKLIEVSGNEEKKDADGDYTITWGPTSVLEIGQLVYLHIRNNHNNDSVKTFAKVLRDKSGRLVARPL